MPRRLHQTLADYLVLAVTPALIMFMVGSLVQFLLSVFYQGNYPERLSFTLTMFVFAAVLIARISITEGSEKAIIYGAALGLVVAIALDSYVDYGKKSPIRFSWLINVSLMALVWWYSHKLTWDCTLIGDSEDAGGEGLLQSAGLDRSGAGEAAAVPAAPPVPEPEFVTDRRLSPARWWQRYVERRRQPHAHGVWVIYFSLAALPLFGIGQLFFSAMSLDRRRYAFGLVCVYVASGLGLLLTTSFLGLRRYLRHRGLEMPLAMAGSWVAVGSALVVGVLVFAALLPRPNPEYAISELPIQVGSPDQRASAQSIGNEGTPNEEGGKGTTEHPKPEAKQGPNSQSESSGDNKSQGKDGSSAKPAEGAKSEGTSAKGDASGGKSQEGDKSKSSDSGDHPSEQGDKTSRGDSKDNSPSGGKSQSKKEGSKSASSKQPPSNQAQSKQAGGQPEPKSSQSADAPKKGEPSPSEANKNEASKTDSLSSTAERKPQPKTSAKSTSPPTVHPPISFLPVANSVSGMIRWAFYGLLIFCAAWGLWNYHREVLAWLMELIEQLRQLWESIFGGPRCKRRESPDFALPIGPIYKSFSEFADPFTSGLAARSTAADLVNYSFEALEAWAREQGLARREQETPLEFSRRLGRQAANVSADAERLAGLYCQIAYANATLSPQGVEHVRQFWRTLTRAAPIQTPDAA